ncbi:MAG: MFS transporter, partial [Polyangiaceae bacterium]
MTEQASALTDERARLAADVQVVVPASPAIAWVPSAYFAEGVPYAIATWAAGTMLKDLGHSDGDITVATAFIGLAWSLKPLWAAFLDMYRTKKFFVIAMQLVMTVLLGAMALSLGVPDYLPIVIAVLWLIAFASATQDICIDGIYITSLDEKRQSAWMGVQGVAWVLGRIFATMTVVWLAGRFERAGFARTTAWTYALAASAAVMGALALYHHLVLPTGSMARRPSESERAPAGGAARVVTGVSIGVVLAAVLGHFFTPTLGLLIGGGSAASIVVGWRDHVPPFLALIRKKSIWGMLVFVLLYRTGEGFLLQEAPLFLQSALDKGGVGLSLEQKSFVDGLSTIASLGGGLLGGAVAAKYGLRRVLLVLALSMNVPHLCYIFLSQAVTPTAPLGIGTVCLLVSIEKLGYSFGFVGNMLYMMQQIA